MPYERPSTQTDHRYVKERAPFQKSILGLAAQLFFKFPELFAITSEPILDLMPIGVYISNKSGNLYYANPTFAHMLGYGCKDEFKQEVLNNGGLQSVYFDPKARDKWITQHSSLKPKKQMANEVASEQQLKKKDGTIITVRDTGIQIGTDYNGQPVYFGGIEDISEEVKLRKELERLLLTDPLTGVGNRRAFEQALKKEVSRTMRTYSPFSVIMLDIDLFKNTNDASGHLAGDEVLIQMSHEIAKRLRGDIDTFARYGGEEFIVILPETGIEQASMVAEDIRSRIEELYIPFDKYILHNTISLGVTSYDQVNMTKEGLLKRVDAALYEAKKRGRNRSVIYEAGMVGKNT